MKSYPWNYSWMMKKLILTNWVTMIFFEGWKPFVTFCFSPFCLIWAAHDIKILQPNRICLLNSKANPATFHSLPYFRFDISYWEASKCNVMWQNFHSWGNLEPIRVAWSLLIDSVDMKLCKNPQYFQRYT
jgi:hypothetical protein